MNLTARPDRPLIPVSGGAARYALVTFSAPLTKRAQTRRPVNVGLVLDRSGSMGGQKIALAREATARALGMLRPQDRFALVVYDDRIDVLVESTHASREAVRNAMRRLDAIDARGSTNLGEGWLRGCEQVAQHLDGASIARCLLMTDGLANVGITDHAELVRHARELKARGVATSTFGVGADFDERLLLEMADAGGGHFYFIERAVQIPDLICSEVGEALEVVARDVSLAVSMPVGGSAATLNDLPSARDGHSLRIDLGDLVSGQEASIVVKLAFPPGEEGQELFTHVAVADRDGVLAGERAEAAWKFADDRASEGQTRNVEVDREVAKLYAARARQEAVELNRVGRFDAARQRLTAAVDRIAQYAGGDAEIATLVRELREDAEIYGEMMAPMALKMAHQLCMTPTRMRDPIGRAKRSE